MKTDKEFLQWIFDRISNVYGENESTDFMLRFREIINTYESEIPLLLKLVNWLETSPKMSQERYLEVRNSIYDEAKRLIGERKQ